MSVFKLTQTEDEFALTGEQQTQALELEACPAVVTDSAESFQVEFFLPESNPEEPATSPQIEFEGMPTPRYEVTIDDGRAVYFQHAHTLLESLETQGVEIQYQCREGYCGSCRVELIDGEVYYYEEPMAWEIGRASCRERVSWQV